MNYNKFDKKVILFHPYIEQIISHTTKTTSLKTITVVDACSQYWFYNFRLFQKKTLFINMCSKEFKSY